MYVVDLAYKTSKDAIEPHLQSHLAFIKKYIEDETFLAAGPKSPRSGGVILVSEKLSRSQLDELLRQDPFYKFGIAEYTVAEFSANHHHPALGAILQD